MAPSADQIAGALLEEAVLFLLRSAGFMRVLKNNNDPTIDPKGPPITIRGRGTTHQIDAVADPVIGYPFTNPARLLVEAKAYSNNRCVGLQVVRNAVGTLKDVSEFWNSGTKGKPAAQRYHYRYAIFASSEFSSQAQAYAFTQDVYLLPLRRSAFFYPVVDAIEGLRNLFKENPGQWTKEQTLAAYRDQVRQAIESSRPAESEELRPLVEAVKRIGDGLIATATRQFPIFLVPRNPEVVTQLRNTERVRIFWDNEGWYLQRADNGDNLFSFDLPQELFALYATDGRLKQAQALRLKAERLAVLQAFHVQEQGVRLIQFHLDSDWIKRLLEAHPL